MQSCMREVLLLAAVSVAAVCLWNSLYEAGSMLYLLESIFMAIYLVGAEVPNYRLQEKENTIYQELLTYLSKVKHCYIACHHISNAVADAAEGMSYETARLASVMSALLMETDRKEKIREYIVKHKINRYLKMFLIQAYEVSEKGDMFFAENVEHIRLEIMEEVYRRKRRSYEFTGYMFVTVAPFFLLPVLKQWSLDFAPELKYFYAGVGILLETVIFIATLVIYGMISRAKRISLFVDEADEKIIDLSVVYENALVSGIIRRMERSGGRAGEAIRELLLKSGETISYGRFCFQIVLWIVSSFLLLTSFYAEIHRKERQTVLEQVESIDAIAPVAGEEKKKILADYILEITEACLADTDVTEEEIRVLLRHKVKLGNESIETAMVQEIKNKLQQYEDAKETPAELLICVLGSLIVGSLPILKLRFQVKLLRSEAEYEVRQFQSLLLMERKMKGTTIMGLLEDMEVFSRCFKCTLRKCISSYGADPEGALLRLKQEGGQLHTGFEELADAFLSVDEVGIELAFEEVENNRRLLEKMSRLEAEISIERKKDSIDSLARIPMVLAVGIYFILPFAVYSLQGAFEVFELLEEMQR